MLSAIMSKAHDNLLATVLFAGLGLGLGMGVGFQIVAETKNAMFPYKPTHEICKSLGFVEAK